jgi:hypothetical protein
VNLKRFFLFYYFLTIDLRKNIQLILSLKSCLCLIWSCSPIVDYHEADLEQRTPSFLYKPKDKSWILKNLDQNFIFADSSMTNLPFYTDSLFLLSKEREVLDKIRLHHKVPIASLYDISFSRDFLKNLKRNKKKFFYKEESQTRTVWSDGELQSFVSSYIRILMTLMKKINGMYFAELNELIKTYFDQYLIGDKSSDMVIHEFVDHYLEKLKIGKIQLFDESLFQQQNQSSGLLLLLRSIWLTLFPLYVDQVFNKIMLSFDFSLEKLNRKELNSLLVSYKDQDFLSVFINKNVNPTLNTLLFLSLHRNLLNLLGWEAKILDIHGYVVPIFKHKQNEIDPKWYLLDMTKLESKLIIFEDDSLNHILDDSRKSTCLYNDNSWMMTYFLKSTIFLPLQNWSKFDADKAYQCSLLNLPNRFENFYFNPKSQNAKNQNHTAHNLKDFYSYASSIYQFQISEQEKETLFDKSQLTEINHDLDQNIQKAIHSIGLHFSPLLSSFETSDFLKSLHHDSLETYKSLEVFFPWLFFYHQRDALNVLPEWKLKNILKSLGEKLKLHPKKIVLENTKSSNKSLKKITFQSNSDDNNPWLYIGDYYIDASQKRIQELKLPRWIVGDLHIYSISKDFKFYNQQNLSLIFTNTIHLHFQSEEDEIWYRSFLNKELFLHKFLHAHLVLDIPNLPLTIRTSIER